MAHVGNLARNFLFVSPVSFYCVSLALLGLQDGLRAFRLQGIYGFRGIGAGLFLALLVRVGVYDF